VGSNISIAHHLLKEYFPGMFTPNNTHTTLSILLLVLLSATLTSRAQIPSPQHGTYVNDRAGVLDKEAIAGLNEQIHTLEKNYSVQLAIVLVDKLPDGMSIEDYARQIGKKWHVGIRDSGLVYVAAIGQKKQRLEVSNALTALLSDSVAHAITDKITPFFRNKDFAGGLKGMVGDIDDRLHPQDASTDQDTPPPSTTTVETIQTPHEEDHTVLLVFVVLSSAAVIWALIKFVFPRTATPKMTRNGGSYSDNTAYIVNADDAMYYDNQDNGNIIATAGAAAIVERNNETSHSFDSDFGNWGGSDSGTSDPGFSSSDSGFSGGGSTNDW
jgi:uncharacterized membrane protein YgcG